MEDKILRLGDQEVAILTIQSTQSDPQKAIAELIENSIDAGAKTVKILRHRNKGKVEIVIIDNGEGVKAGCDGNSDMDRIATSICDSFKKKLEAHLRENIQGEFAIGLLGFAAIGENLEILSKTETSSKTNFLRLKAGSIKYESGTTLQNIQKQGTEVRIWPVRENITQRLTAEKLNKYLGEELCDRIKTSQVSLLLEDKVGRKVEIEVKPQDFKGERISAIDKVLTLPGNIFFKLYIAQEGEEGKVSIYRHGTKVIDNVTEIHELNHEPWNNLLLEGMIDSRFINVPPGTRKGIVPDEHFEELLKALISQEKQLISILKEASARREKELGKDIIKQLKDAFSDLMHELPNEYNWFGTKGDRSIPDRNNRSNKDQNRFKTLISLGPIEYVTVTPKVSQIAPNEIKKFVAKAWTLKDEFIPINVNFKWKLQPENLGSLDVHENECLFKAGLNEGEVQISLFATLSGKCVQTSVDVLILKQTDKKAQTGFPNPIGIDMPSESWRSRWNESVNTLEYNTGHDDYKKADKRGKKTYIRYIGFLYAKHLVLHNFKESGEDSVLERMIEVISHLEVRI
jgi:hypothetical protein